MEDVNFIILFYGSAWHKSNVLHPSVLILLLLKFYNWKFNYIFFVTPGSKDNISAVVVRLPGAKIPAGRVPPAANVRQRMDSKVDDEGVGEIGVPHDINIW